MPPDMRRLTFENIVDRHKRFDCVLDRFLTAIFGGLEQTSYKFFLLVRDQWTGKRPHSQPSIFVTVLSVLWIPIPVDIPSLKSDFCKMKFLGVKMLSSTFTLARINIIL